MTEYWQRVALASLDGLSIGKDCDHGNDCDCQLTYIPNYPGDYNAIIPLIQKQAPQVKRKIERSILSGHGSTYLCDATPQEWAKQLLIACNLWIE